MDTIFDTRFKAGGRGFEIAFLLLLFWGCASDKASRRGTDYVPDASYHLLMAEIALERSEYLVAVKEYLRAAEASTDSNVARRSTEFALSKEILTSLRLEGVPGALVH